MKRIFQSKTIAKYLIWHAIGREVDPSVLRYPSDSPSWSSIVDKFPDFGIEPRNIRLGMLDNGVDVHGENKNHNVWYVLNVIYNFLP